MGPSAIELSFALRHDERGRSRTSRCHRRSMNRSGRGGVLDARGRSSCRTGTISHLEILLAVHSKDRQADVSQTDSRVGRRNPTSLSSLLFVAVARHDVDMYPYINNATNASQEGEDAFGNRRAVSYRWRARGGLVIQCPFCFDKILGYLRLNRLQLLGLDVDDLGITVDGRAHGGWGGLDDDASGKWGGGTPSSDGTAMPTWGRRRDRTTRTLPPWTDGSGSSYIRPSRWESPSSSFDCRRGWDYDFGLDPTTRGRDSQNR